MDIPACGPAWGAYRPTCGASGELEPNAVHHQRYWFCRRCSQRTSHGPTTKALFAFLREQHIQLDVEVGAVKPWGPTGDKTFTVEKKEWNRFIADGADIHGIAMDEPLVATFNNLHQPMSYAVEETAQFVSLVRKNYPEFVIGDIEGYPYLNKQQLLSFWDGLDLRLKSIGVRGLDYVRLDVDWMHFVHHSPQGKLGWVG
jgi:hypothetical protein